MLVLFAHARTAIESFLTECYQDPHATVDAFVYDLNEPAIITALIELASMGKLRLLADDATLHGEGTAAAKAFSDIQSAATEATRAGFMRGKFKRYQHNKVLVKKVSGVAQWVRRAPEKQRREQSLHQPARRLSAGSVRHLDLGIAEADGNTFSVNGGRTAQAIEVRLVTIAALRCS